MLRANHRGVDHYIHRNFSCDGVPRFTLDPNVELVKQDVEAGDHVLTVQFHHPIRCFRKVTTWFEATLDDAFIGSRERLILLIDQKVREVGVEIIFPNDRLPRSLNAFYRRGGMDEPLPPPELKGDRISLKHRALYRLPYGEIQVVWTW